MTKNPCPRLLPHWTAVFASFGVVVLGNVLQHGIGRPSGGKLVTAAILLVVVAWTCSKQLERYRRLDELQQRIQLESLASAFAGTFLIFTGYWLLQMAGLLPPMEGLYFLLA